MVCDPSVPFYVPAIVRGLKNVATKGDGYTMILEWNKAYPNPSAYSLAYNIYYSTFEENLFWTQPKFVSIATNQKTEIVDFIPGDVCYFAVRATQYDPSWYNINLLSSDTSQIDTNLKIYPETLLLEDINDEQLIIPITDIDLYPAFGIIQVGYELIRYLSKDIPNCTLLVSERGFMNTEPRFHTIDGYDGYEFLDPIIKFYKGIEEDNNFSIQKICSFYDPNYAFTVQDGYRERNLVGQLTTDLDYSDQERIDFRAYDFSGWHRTDPSMLFKGECLDTYIGGENFCADGYLGIDRQVRNIPLSEQVDRLQEYLLEDVGTGEPVVLLRRLWAGITCSCFEPNREYPEPRCPRCLGSSFIGGYDQFYNPRRSDRRILVRFGPAEEDLKMEDGGLESTIIYDCWTLTVPTLRDRDVIIRFNEDGTEEYRYEILSVTRNKLLYSQNGKQSFRVQRIRKTDIIYQWKPLRNAEFYPLQITTTVGLLRGSNNTMIPHTHEIVVNENISSINQINQTTNISANHNHEVRSGAIIDTLGHSHQIIL
jgi:hypothetical protein